MIEYLYCMFVTRLPMVPGGIRAYLDTFVLRHPLKFNVRCVDIFFVLFNKFDFLNVLLE